ncbi:MAG: hypothetical protein LQ347_006780, partial [Umbilicaria vellea]
WEACIEIPRSLHDVLGKYWPSVKLYVTNDSQIGATWTLLGSSILYSLKGRYKRFISARGVDSEHWQKTYFSACPNLREFECVEVPCKDVSPSYHVDVESFNYGLRANNTDWPALETFKVSGTGKWIINYYDWYICRIDWTILRSLDLRSASPRLVLELNGKVPALRFLGFDINGYVDLFDGYLCSTPWLEELAVRDRRFDAPKHLPLFKAPGNTLASLDYRSFRPWSALELCKLKEICPMLSVLGVCIDYQIPWPEEIIVALSAFTEVQHFALTINIGRSNIEVLDPLIRVASAKSLFLDLRSRMNGCFRKLTLRISLCEPIPNTPWSRGKELTLRCRLSERDDRPEEIVVDVEDKESDHWRRVKDDWESGSHEWVSCDALERAVSAEALVKKWQEIKKASEEKQ